MEEYEYRRTDCFNPQIRNLLVLLRQCKTKEDMQANIQSLQRRIQILTQAKDLTIFLPNSPMMRELYIRLGHIISSVESPLQRNIIELLHYICKNETIRVNLRDEFCYLFCINQMAAIVSWKADEKDKLLDLIGCLSEGVKLPAGATLSRIVDLAVGELLVRGKAQADCTSALSVLVNMLHRNHALVDQLIPYKKEICEIFKTVNLSEANIIRETLILHWLSQCRIQLDKAEKDFKMMLDVVCKQALENDALAISHACALFEEYEMLGKVKPESIPLDHLTQVLGILEMKPIMESKVEVRFSQFVKCIVQSGILSLQDHAGMLFEWVFGIHQKEGCACESLSLAETLVDQADFSLLLPHIKGLFTIINNSFKMFIDSQDTYFSSIVLFKTFSLLEIISEKGKNLNHDGWRVLQLDLVVNAFFHLAQLQEEESPQKERHNFSALFLKFIRVLQMMKNTNEEWKSFCEHALQDPAVTSALAHVLRFSHNQQDILVALETFRLIAAVENWEDSLSVCMSQPMQTVPGEVQIPIWSGSNLLTIPSSIRSNPDEVPEGLGCHGLIHLYEMALKAKEEKEDQQKRLFEEQLRSEREELLVVKEMLMGWKATVASTLAENQHMTLELKQQEEKLMSQSRAIKELQERFQKAHLEWEDEKQKLEEHSQELQQKLETKEQDLMLSQQHISEKTHMLKKMQDSMKHMKDNLDEMELLTQSQEGTIKEKEIIISKKESELEKLRIEKEKLQAEVVHLEKITDYISSIAASRKQEPV
ncbi:unnamed protein product [Darwinula stevensoni]|uniref:Uncharacterized protein n=1 Tax=Darwinula stevensoni TaxID=69355 RepID=A0A7R9A5T8_9CRUS|nr:unnamed protein product [Darwinula stevensoni]CAG0887188.1 unnamed protein product [Darwinula stevensoni]